MPDKNAAWDRKAFAELIESHGDRWYAVCLRLTCDAALAEDAVQEALLTAWKQRGKYRGDARLETWIHRIAINAALQMLRKRGVLAADDDLLEEAGGESPLRTFSRSAFGEDLSRAMNGLSPRERTCFLLRYVEQWRLEEISAAQAASVNSIKQALFRAMCKLRARLAHWSQE